jgi:hypothetical protein
MPSSRSKEPPWTVFKVWIEVAEHNKDIDESRDVELPFSYMEGDFLRVMFKAKELRDRDYPDCAYVCHLNGKHSIPSFTAGKPLVGAWDSKDERSTI